MLSITTLALLMVLNGVLFLPPSEYVYFDAYFSLGGSIGYRYAILPLANSVGHFILFEISKRHSQKLVTFESGSSTNILSSAIRYALRTSRGYFRRHDQHAWAVFYGRCVPVVHTGISIIAGIAGVSRLRFLMLTVAGNCTFSIVCWLIVGALSSTDDYYHSIVLVAVVFGGLYIAHIFVERHLNKHH